MVEYKELNEALRGSDKWVDAHKRTDASDANVYEQAAQRIKDLNEVEAEQEQRLTELEIKLEKKSRVDSKEQLLREKKMLRKSIAGHKADLAELDKKEYELRETLAGDSRSRKLFQIDSADSEIGKLKAARMNVYERAHGLEDKGPISEGRMKGHSVVSDSLRNSGRNRSTRISGKMLCNDGLDPEVDALKQKRQNIYEDAQKKRANRWS
ncbi:MAG: hypothetical protein ABIH20_01805 [Candidatus Diapherotrites archaeon]